jgi:hypothetical protein
MRIDQACNAKWSYERNNPICYRLVKNTEDLPFQRAMDDFNWKERTKTSWDPYLGTLRRFQASRATHPPTSEIALDLLAIG